MLTINIVLNNVELLEYSTTTDGILENIIPQAILNGKTLNYKNHTAITFGQYLQIHEKNTPCNSTKPQTRGALCTSPIGNKKKFKIMTSWYMKKATSRIWDAFLMPDIFIAKVNALCQGRPSDLELLDI